MSIFNKENGTHLQSIVPLKTPKKFFNMSKSTVINLVLQKNGDNNCHTINYQLDTNFYHSLS